jgi:hypothetical protein
MKLNLTLECGGVDIEYECTMVEYECKLEFRALITRSLGKVVYILQPPKYVQASLRWCGLVVRVACRRGLGFDTYCGLWAVSNECPWFRGKLWAGGTSRVVNLEPGSMLCQQQSLVISCQS